MYLKNGYFSTEPIVQIVLENKWLTQDKDTCQVLI
jgi:hypothetical protein